MKRINFSQATRFWEAGLQGPDPEQGAAAAGYGQGLGCAGASEGACWGF